MIMRFLKSKLFLFLAFVLFTGFIIGYDYAVITSRNHAALSVKAPETVTGENEDKEDNNRITSGDNP